MINWRRFMKEVEAAEKRKPRQYWVMFRTGEENAIIHFQRPGEAGRQHVVTAMFGSWDKPVIELMTLLDGPHGAGAWHVHSHRDIHMNYPLGNGHAMAATLNPVKDAHGALTVIGYTEDVPEVSDGASRP